MKLTTPKSGEGWAQLFTTPKYNGGDTLPPELAGELDGVLELMPPGSLVGVTQDGTPAALFVFQEVGPGEVTVHYSSDGRVPPRVTLDILTELVRARPGVTFLAYCRRPAAVRLLASRGWWLRAHEDEPFLALMVCQPDPGPSSE